MPYSIELVDCDGRAVVRRIWKGAQPQRDLGSSSSSIASPVTPPRSKRPRLPNKTNKKLKVPSIKRSKATVPKTSYPYSNFKITSPPVIYSPHSEDYGYLRFASSVSSPPDFSPASTPFSSPISDYCLEPDIFTCPNKRPLDNFLKDDVALHLSELHESLADPFTLIPPSPLPSPLPRPSPLPLPLPVPSPLSLPPPRTRTLAQQMFLNRRDKFKPTHRSK